MSKKPVHIHFICRESKKSGYVDNDDGTFSTAAWPVSAIAAMSVQTIALHHTKNSDSWAQGEVVSRTRVKSSDGVRPGRWEFVVKPTATQFTWPDDVSGSSTMGYIY